LAPRGPDEAGRNGCTWQRLRRTAQGDDSSPVNPMNPTTRRVFIRNTAAAAGGLCTAGFSNGVEILSGTTKPSDVRIESLSCSYEEHVFRAPLKFALTVVDRATLLTVNCTVRTREGKAGAGFGTIPLNYTFSYPSAKLSEQARLGAMKSL